MHSLNTLEQFERVIAESHDQPRVIFKHSRMCAISRAAYERVQQGITRGFLEDHLVHMTVVQDTPELKMTIARMLGVPHDSPQVIVLKNGIPVYVASHDDITVEALVHAITSAV